MKIVGTQSAVVALLVELFSGFSERSVIVAILLVTALSNQRALRVLVHSVQFMLLGLLAVYESTTPLTIGLLAVSISVFEIPFRRELVIIGVKIAGFLIFMSTILYFARLSSAQMPTFPAVLSYASLMASGVTALHLCRRLQMLVDRELRASRDREMALDRLQDTAVSLLQHADEVRRVSRLEERRWISEQLHDIVGQSLSQIIMMMNAMERRVPTETAETYRTIVWVRDIAQNGLREARSVLYRVFSNVKERQPTCLELYRLLKIFEKISGMDLKIEWRNLSDPVLSGVFDVVYAVLAEALTNSYRHGNATVVQIMFWVDAGTLQVRIDDNGDGIPNASEGLGLQSMRDRVEGAGGTLAHHNSEQGYLVLVTLPIK